MKMLVLLGVVVCLGLVRAGSSSQEKAIQDGILEEMRWIRGALERLETKVDGVANGRGTNQQSDERLLTRLGQMEEANKKFERILTEITKKTYYQTQSIFEKVTNALNGSGDQVTTKTTGVTRRPGTLSSDGKLDLISDSVSSLSREVKESMDVFQTDMTTQMNNIMAVSMQAFEKAEYISQNMITLEDSRSGADNPQIVENDMDKVLEEVRQGFRRCTRAVVNAPLVAHVSPPANVTSATPSIRSAPEITYYIGTQRDGCKKTAAVKDPKDCDQLFKAGSTCDGTYLVYARRGGIKVSCDMTGGGWTILMNRGSFSSSPLSFDKPWSAYKFGFGNTDQEFYIGNEYIHDLTKRPKMLRVQLESFEGEKIDLDFANFTIGPESDRYRMRLGQYLGKHPRIGNAFRRHNDQQFLTVDQVVSGPNQHCPSEHKAGYWYHTCYSVLLTGEWAPKDNPKPNTGIRWSTWKSEPLKGVVMKIRDMP